jgi:hypothetical protein
MEMGRSRPHSSASGWRATSRRGVPKAPYSLPGAAARPTLGRGFFIEPTVFARVDHASTIATAEIFGPVLSIIAARDEIQAVDLANDSPFRLNDSVFASDVDRAYAVARQLRSVTLGHKLRLDADQTAYVEGLVGQTGSRPQPCKRSRRAKVHPHLERLLSQLEDLPAMILGPRLDILAWNPLAAALYVDFGALSDRERNYVRLVVTNPVMRALYADWDGVARRGVEFLRMEAGEHPGDPALTRWSASSQTQASSSASGGLPIASRSRISGPRRCAPSTAGEITLNWDTFK